MMTTFEEMFGSIEADADEAKKAVASVARNVAKLRKVAQDGNINGIKKARKQLNQSFGVLNQTVVAVLSDRSFTDEGISSYLDEKYTDELCQEARKLGFEIFERDGVLISYPSTIRLLPAQSALRIDKKKVLNIRPSKLANILLANREKGATFKSVTFLEALYKVYNVITKSQSAGSRSALVVPLEAIYNMFTSLPGSKRDYDKMDFARDIYLLDTGEMRETKSGASVSFPASTAIKSGRGIISFVDPNGNAIHYHGIQFSGGS